MSSEFWGTQPVIPVIVINDESTAVELARILVSSGLPQIEITLRTKAALKSIELISKQVPEALVGAGTVLTKELGISAKSAGASFLVSPGATENVLNNLLDIGLPLLPGCATVSEALLLIEHGITAAKFFPAVESGGISWLKALSSVLPQLSFCPTGGISEKNYREFLSLPNVICVGGSWVAPNNLIQEENWREISRLARAVFN